MSRPRRPELSKYPASLDDLLADKRGVKTRHHLRRAYVHPFTDAPDWMLLPAPGDPLHFVGLNSRSEQQLLRQSLDDGTPLSKARDRIFLASAYDDRQAPPHQPALPPPTAEP